ncbi:MAG: hypothetical protein WEB00_14110 [Dehalococcoidia bacterium]
MSVLRILPYVFYVVAVLFFFVPGETVGIVMAIGAVFAAMGFGHLAQKQETRKRRQALGDFAVERGLTFVAEGDAAYAGLPLAHTTKHKGKVLWVIRGRYLGRDIASFDHEYVVGSGKRRKVVQRTIAFVEFDSDLPGLSLDHWSDTVFMRLGERLGLVHDVKTSDIAFDKAFQVESQDEAFALQVLYPAMREWLLRVSRDWAFQVAGRYAACLGPERQAIDVSRLPDLLEACIQFERQIPSWVLSTPFRATPSA